MKGRKGDKRQRDIRVAFWATIADGRLTGGPNLERATRLLKTLQDGDVRVVVWGRPAYGTVLSPKMEMPL